jgi:hypothetical protein
LPGNPDKIPAAIVDVDGILTDGKHQSLVSLHPFKDRVQATIRLEKVVQEGFSNMSQKSSLRYSVQSYSIGLCDTRRLNHQCRVWECHSVLKEVFPKPISAFMLRQPF